MAEISVPFFNWTSVRGFFDTKTFSQSERAFSTLGTLFSVTHRFQSLLGLESENTLHLGNAGNDASNLSGWFSLGSCTKESHDIYRTSKEIDKEINVALITHAVVRVVKVFADFLRFLDTMVKNSVLRNVHIGPLKLPGKVGHVIYLIHYLSPCEKPFSIDKDKEISAKNKPITLDLNTLKLNKLVLNTLDTATLKEIPTKNLYPLKYQQYVYFDTLEKVLTLSTLCIAIFASSGVLHRFSVPMASLCYNSDVSLCLSAGTTLCSIGSYLSDKQMAISKEKLIEKKQKAEKDSLKQTLCSPQQRCGGFDDVVKSTR